MVAWTGIVCGGGEDSRERVRDEPWALARWRSSATMPAMNQIHQSDRQRTSSAWRGPAIVGAAMAPIAVTLWMQLGNGVANANAWGQSPARRDFARAREVWLLPSGSQSACEARSFESPSGRAAYGTDPNGRIYSRGSIGPARAPTQQWDQSCDSIGAAGAVWQEKVDEIWYAVGTDGWHVFQVDTERGTADGPNGCGGIPTKEFTYFMRAGQ